MSRTVLVFYLDGQFWYARIHPNIGVLGRYRTMDASIFNEHPVTYLRASRSDPKPDPSMKKCLRPKSLEKLLKRSKLDSLSDLKVLY